MYSWNDCLVSFWFLLPFCTSFPSLNPRLYLTWLCVCMDGCQLLLQIGNYLSTTEEDPDRKYWVTPTGSDCLKSRRKISPLSVRYKFSHWENNKCSHLSVLVSVFPLFFHPEMVSCLQAFLHPWLPSVSFHSWSWSIWWMWLCLAFCTEGVVERYCTIISITQCPSVCQSYFYNL